MMTAVAEVTSAKAVVTVFDELGGVAGAHDEVIKKKWQMGRMCLNKQCKKCWI